MSILRKITRPPFAGETIPGHPGTPPQPAGCMDVVTIEPGFTADEPVDALGAGLKLPPWEEPHRADIESALAPISG